MSTQPLNAVLTIMQPPELMQMTLMHHQKHQKGIKHILAVHDVVQYPSISHHHINSCMVLLPGMNKAW